ncbi:MAG: phosphonate C-P lyase system protein PhnG [Pseudomonadota bacterium]
MRVYASATEAELAFAISEVGGVTGAIELRAPETGLVMLRGRIGGDGAPFNVGEATVTRAVVQLKSGEVGYGFLLGRSAARARSAAILDALAQTSQAARTAIEAVLITPVTTRMASEAAEAQAKTASTKVDFFTLVRGED